MPTPPRPTTATVWPARGVPTFSTAPPPVSTAQPNKDATDGGDIIRDGHHRPAVDDGVGGETGYAEVVEHRLAVAGQPDVAVHQRARAVGGRSGTAGCQPVGGAGGAVPAARQERHHHSLAHRQIGVTGLDDPGGFMAQQHRDGAHPVAVHHGRGRSGTTPRPRCAPAVRPGRVRRARGRSPGSAATWRTGGRVRCARGRRRGSSYPPAVTSVRLQP